MGEVPYNCCGDSYCTSRMSGNSFQFGIGVPDTLKPDIASWGTRIPARLVRADDRMGNLLILRGRNTLDVAIQSRAVGAVVPPHE